MNYVPDPEKIEAGVKILAEEIENASARGRLIKPQAILRSRSARKLAGSMQRSAWVGQASTQAGPPSRCAHKSHFSA